MSLFTGFTSQVVKPEFFHQLFFWGKSSFSAPVLNHEGCIIQSVVDGRHPAGCSGLSNRCRIDSGNQTTQEKVVTKK